jgi:hypothetical protein
VEVSPQRRLHGSTRRVGRSVGEGSEEWLRLELELSVSRMGTRQSSWHGRLGRTVAGGVCPRGDARGGGRSPAGCPGEGPRLGDWARGRVEEDWHEAADYPAGGAVVRLVDDIAWRGAARSLGEQGQAERVKRMGKSSKGKQVNLASSRVGAEDIGEREGVVHVEATPHGRRVEVARRPGRTWRAR